MFYYIDLPFMAGSAMRRSMSATLAMPKKTKRAAPCSLDSAGPVRIRTTQVHAPIIAFFFKSRPTTSGCCILLRLGRLLRQKQMRRTSVCASQLAVRALNVVLVTCWTVAACRYQAKRVGHRHEREQKIGVGRLCCGGRAHAQRPVMRHKAQQRVATLDTRLRTRIAQAATKIGTRGAERRQSAVEQLCVVVPLAVISDHSGG